MGPKQYRKQIFELGIEGMEVNVSTIDDAMFTLNEIKEIEKILIKIRYNVRSDIRRIRLEYMTKLQGIDQSERKIRTIQKEEIRD